MPLRRPGLVVAITSGFLESSHDPFGSVPMTRDPPFLSGGTDGLSWLDRGGEAGALIRAFDWTRTPLGALEAWPQSLRTITGMLLLSPVPIVLLWGQQGTMIYNDAYSVFAGARHPRLLGSEVRKGWAEIADFNDNVMRVGLAGGTLAYKDQQLTLERNGKPEPVWMNLDYSPVLDESGTPGGVIAFVVPGQTSIAVGDREVGIIRQCLGVILNGAVQIPF